MYVGDHYSFFIQIIQNFLFIVLELCIAVRRMPKVKTNRVKYPEGWELIEPTLRELQGKMREGLVVFIFFLKFIILFFTGSIFSIVLM